MVMDTIRLSPPAAPRSQYSLLPTVEGGGYVSKGEELPITTQKKQKDGIKLQVLTYLTIGHVVVQALASVKFSSDALLSDSFHNLGDVATLFLALYIHKLDSLPPTAELPFGFQRADVIGGLINAVAMVTLSVYQILNSLPRVLLPEEIEASWVFVCICISGIIVNMIGVIMFIQNSRKAATVLDGEQSLKKDFEMKKAAINATSMCHHEEYSSGGMNVSRKSVECCSGGGSHHHHGHVENHLEGAAIKQLCSALHNIAQSDGVSRREEHHDIEALQLCSVLPLSPRDMTCQFTVDTSSSNCGHSRHPSDDSTAADTPIASLRVFDLPDVTPTPTPKAKSKALWHGHSHCHDHGSGSCCDHGAGEDGWSMNLWAVLIHSLMDALSSAAITCAAIIIHFCGIPGVVDWTDFLDPLLSIGLSLMTAACAAPLVKESIHVLLEGTPRGIDEAAVRRALTNVRGVESVEFLTLMQLNGTAPHVASVKLRVKKGWGEEVQAGNIMWGVKDALAVFGVGNSTVELMHL